MIARRLTTTCLLLCLSTGMALAKKKSVYEKIRPLTPDQTELIQKAVAREKVVIKNLQERTPVVETYIQNMKPDQKLYMVPVSDQYMLSRVDFGKTFTDTSYQARPSSRGFFRGSLKAISGLTKMFQLEYVPSGFMQMMLIDPTGFDQQHYDFSYVRREFLGNVRTTVFDVFPKSGTGKGRFLGRIWVEDQDGNVVRFNGTYSGNNDEAAPRYFHFDSWRMNIQPDVWLPTAIFAEETQRSPNEKNLGFRGQTHFWGYALKLPARESENVDIKVENATDSSDNSQDVSPLQANRAWVSQAENNVVDRLVAAGLVAQPSDFDKVLEQVTQNIIIGNNLNMPDPIHCRVMLTEPLESLAVGNTILISKGLVDVLPNEEGLAAILAFQLAHITLGHHIDTRYAFNDRLLFPDEASFAKIDMTHSNKDNEDAAKKAVDLLKNSTYKDKLPDAGLFFAQLQARAKVLSQLNVSRLGDSVLRPDGTPWLADLAKQSPKLDADNLNQIAALPLGSRLKTDAWDDKVISLNVKQAPLLNARDKMPLEVTPIFLKLARYESAAAPGGAPAPTAPGTAPAPASAPAPPAADSGNPAPQQPPAGNN
jgi:hypothetical protein